METNILSHFKSKSRTIEERIAEGKALRKVFPRINQKKLKGGAVFDPEKVKLSNVPEYCRLCGWALALAHAKSGDAAMLAGYVGNSDELDEAMIRFAFSYAEQNEKDYDALVKAARSGRIQVGMTE
jgi:hypothetical protein